MLKSSLTAAAIMGLAILGAGTVSASSLMSAAPEAKPDAPFADQVRQGCGPGFRRGPYGGCIRQTAPRGPYGANRCWWRNGVRVCR